MSCEHYISISDENWTSENEVEVTAECSECLTKFKGTLKKI
jgi:hypothetical protein